MREKIERFSRGDFEYELPFLCLSEEKIKTAIEAGKVHEGCITIKNSAGKSMKGVLYSSNRLFTLGCDSFAGVDNTVTYLFNATFLKEGDSIDGELTILSDCGEQVVSFSALVEAPYCATSIGKVKDLFQFANLARMDWTEAKKVFRSEDFERVILKNDEKYKVIYHSLLKNVSTSQALEEFLIAIHKKSKISLCINKTHLEYLVSDEEFMDKLVLTKDHWGYAEIRVSTDASFIQLEQKFVWADRFIGNTHQISFLIIPKNMRHGNNFGRIWIKTIHQTITVEVVCRYVKQAGNEEHNRKIEKKIVYGLTRNYLDFRMDRIHLAKYAEVTETLLKGLPEGKDSYKSRLINIHLAIISDRKRAAGQLLDEMAKEESALRKKSTLDYCAYLYLDALYHKDDETIKHASDTISRYYVSGNNDWRLLWFLLYSNKRYDKNKGQKLSDIKEQYDAGCCSPILYYEAVLTFNEEPYLLRDLSDFEIQVLNFGIKNSILTKDVSLQYTYLANKKKNFHPVIFKGLTKLYQEYGDTDILTAICCMLIKGYKKSDKYFGWYRLGVEAQLHITELYEYYMYSVDEEMEDPIAQPVLLYFIYNSSLNDRKRAYLYANIIKNKAKNESIYRTYYKRMEVFALKQMEARNITPNLAVLYKEFMNRSGVSDEMSAHLPNVMFTQELSCNNPDMISVSVIHKELEEEENVPLSEGIAHIQLYTQNAYIFLIDSFGNRFAESIDYTLKPLLQPGEQEEPSLGNMEHPMLLLHYCELYGNYRIMSEKSIAVRKKVLLLSNLKEDYYIDCLLAIIDYYYENHEEASLRQYMLQLDLSKVKETDRIKFLEYMVIRGYYDKALEALKYFGFEGISVKRLVRLCSGWISSSGSDIRHELLVTLCHYIFLQGKYDDVILGYLVRHYYGPTSDMINLWQAAKDFEIDTHELEERLLVQMLFSEGYTKDSFKVFNEYYKNVTNHLLVRAFLTFYAYKYLVRDRVISPELFPIMRRELNYEENDTCLLAWLKYNTANNELSQSERDYISYSINYLENKGIVMPFFMDYRKSIQLPERISDKVYVEYRSDPNKQVYIHYRLVKNNSDLNYIIERMPNLLMGIHIKGFTLFYHEVLQYYITEESDGEVNITESHDVRLDRETPEDESKYGQINLMLSSIEVQDEKTLLDLMDNYARLEYMTKECFKPLK